MSDSKAKDPTPIVSGSQVQIACKTGKLLVDPAGTDVVTFTGDNSDAGTVFTIWASSLKQGVRLSYGSQIALQAKTGKFLYDRHYTEENANNYLQFTSGAVSDGERFTIVDPDDDDNRATLMDGCGFTLQDFYDNTLSVEAKTERWKSSSEGGTFLLFKVAN